jgi:hypothetical protein
MEAAIACRVDGLEKLVPLSIDVPVGGQTQRVQIQVPQMSSWRLSERFRWPSSEVLLLSCGIVANPEPVQGGVFSLLSPLTGSPHRADALLMIDHRPPSVTSLTPSPTAAAPAAAKTPPPAKAAAPTAALGTPSGSSTSVSRGRY